MTYNFNSLADARRALRDAAGVASLLARPESNPKLAKGMKMGVLSAPLHLAPADLSGFEVCAMRTPGCTAACLNTAGNPAYREGKQRARLAKTRLYFEQRDLFMAVLVKEIEAFERKANRANMVCGVRLNATSDIVWERVPVYRDGKRFDNIMSAFPNVSFYDYTKRFNRRDLPENYHLTFSLADGNDDDARAAFERGINVAVVFDVKRGHPLPATYGGDPVIDGDLHDYRPADGHGVIVGLRAKGDAIGDQSGFVKSPYN